MLNGSNIKAVAVVGSWPEGLDHPSGISPYGYFIEVSNGSSYGIRFYLNVAGELYTLYYKGKGNSWAADWKLISAT